MKKRKTIFILFMMLAVFMLVEKESQVFAEETDYQGAEEIQQETEVISPEELDLGDYEDTMEVGEKQLLSVTVLPLDATEQKISYSSGNAAVADINGMGRITALSAGTTVITVSCGTLKQELQLTVREREAETEETKAAVTAIEVADHENELEVGKTMTLSATILPSEAEQKISYASNNTGVATVSSTGEIKGIAPGTVHIILTAGGYTRTVELTVKVKTEAIELNQTYVVLKPGEAVQMTASVVPKNASQSVSWHSSDREIAEISDGGKITAKKTGNTTIIVSNSEISNAVTVIVNEKGNKEISEPVVQESEDEEMSENEKKLIGLLESEERAVVQTEEYPYITKRMLKKLYETKKQIEIAGKGYKIILSGKDIVNYENELCTEMKLEKGKGELEFYVNQGENLPEEITLEIEGSREYRYIYLYNQSKEKQEKVLAGDVEKLKIQTAGKYKLTQDKIEGITVKKAALGIGGVIIAGLAGCYIGVKKRYWFW